MQDEDEKQAEHAKRAQLVLRLYEIERAADSQTLNSITALLTTAVGLLSLIGSALIFASRTEDFPGWLLALLPFVPFPFIAYGAMYTHVLTVRGYLIDQYEQELQTSDIGTEPSPVPQTHILLGRIWKGTRGNIAMGVTLGVLLLMYIAILVGSFRYAWRTNPVIAAVSLAACATALTAVIGVYWFALLPERFVQREASRSPDDTKTWLYRVLTAVEKWSSKTVARRTWRRSVLVVPVAVVVLIAPLLGFESSTSNESTEKARAREAASEVRYHLHLEHLTRVRRLTPNVWLAVFGKRKTSRRCFVIHLDSYVPTIGHRAFQGVASVSCPP